MPLFNEVRLATKGVLRRRAQKEKDGEIVKYTGREKVAEPPPPKGVSVEEWDRILQGKQASVAEDIKEVARTLVEEGVARYRQKKKKKTKTAAQDPDKNKDGYKLQGRDNFQGLPIAIENAKGSVREGKNEDGSSWKTKFKTPYGYIEGTKGADGDEIDAYVGPDKKSTKAFVVHQKKDDGSHDEDTVMLGFRSAAAAKKDILRHYDDPKQIGGVTPISVEKLRKKVMPGKKIEKLGTYTGRQPVPWQGENPEHNTGYPATGRRKKNDVPSRDDMKPYPAVEDRMDTLAGKTAEALPIDRALGDQPKRGEAPSRDDVGKGPPETHKGRGGYVQLSDISTANSQEESKTSSALGDALTKIAGRGMPRRKQADHGFDTYGSDVGSGVHSIPSGAAPADGLSKGAMVDELAKLGEIGGELKKKIEKKIEEVRHVDKPEAEKALKRLRKLEKEKPSVGQVARGAGVGAAVGPLANLAFRAGAGSRGRGGGSIWTGARAQLAHAGQGAVYGGLLPAGRHKVEREAEKQKLREYVGERKRGTLRGKIKRHTGI